MKTNSSVLRTHGQIIGSNILLRIKNYVWNTEKTSA